ncbi:MAG: hypothetical protein ABIL62_07520 [Planctomycetota bacterium]
MCSELHNKHFHREVDMYEPLLRLFNNIEIIVAEVPFFGKHIDLIFASKTLLSLYAVETKLRDWRIAFKQAALNQIAAQRSYIAVPRKLAIQLFNSEKELFLRYDVGLIAVSANANILLNATRNGCFSLRHYRVLKKTLNKVKIQKPKKIGVVADAISKRTKTLVVLQTWTSEGKRTI